MIEPFKKLAFHGTDPAEMMQILQDNIEAWTEQFKDYPASVLGLENAKIKRPGYGVTSAGTKIDITGSESAPVRLLINGEIYQSESTIYCDLSKSGAGGLLNGTIAANTPYYLYGHLYKDIPYISASINAPSVGPEGYDHWTYVGACATDGAAATVYPFSAVGGVYSGSKTMAADDILFTGPTAQELTFASMPATATQGYFWLSTRTDGSAGDLAQIGPSETVIDSLRQRCQVTGNVWNYVFGWVPIITPKVVWGQATDANVDISVYAMGWQENPMEYK